MPGLAPRPFARTDITGITRMPARRTVTMGRTFLWAACLSARGLGITAGTGAAILAGPGTATVVGDTAIGRDTPTVARGTAIAQAGPIGAVPLAGMPEAATVAMLEAGPAATSAVVSTVAEASTVVVDSMAAVAAFMVAEATEADTGKTNQVI